MAEFQELLNFPPAPKLDVFGRLDPELATEAELRGEDVGRLNRPICLDHFLDLADWSQTQY